MANAGDTRPTRRGYDTRVGRAVRLNYLGPPHDVGQLAEALRQAGVEVGDTPPRLPPRPLHVITAVALTLTFPAGDRASVARARRVIDQFADEHPRTRLCLVLPRLASRA
jgi:hypothetical protein